MPTYAYTARDSVGKMYRGTLEAVDKKMLRARLREMGYYSTSVRVSHSLLSWGSSKKGGRIRQGELVDFSQQFAAMIKAGLSLTRCLSALEEQSENLQLREVLRAISLDIAGGATLSEALSKHPQTFSNFFVTMV